MTPNEQKKAAASFAEDWKGKGDERQDTQRFWIGFIRKVLGVENAEEHIQFEKQVRYGGHTTFIDAYIEHLSLEFVKYTLDPWLVRWEQGLQKALLSDSEKGRYFIKFNVEGLLRGDYASRMQGYATARQNGWMSANDIRELEDMNAIPDEEGGNLYLVNGSFTKLEDAGAFAEKGGNADE